VFIPGSESSLIVELLGSIPLGDVSQNLWSTKQVKKIGSESKKRARNGRIWKFVPNDSCYV